MTLSKVSLDQLSQNTYGRDDVHFICFPRPGLSIHNELESLCHRLTCRIICSGIVFSKTTNFEMCADYKIKQKKAE